MFCFWGQSVWSRFHRVLGLYVYKHCENAGLVQGPVSLECLGSKILLNCLQYTGERAPSFSETGSRPLHSAWMEQCDKNNRTTVQDCSGMAIVQAITYNSHWCSATATVTQHTRARKCSQNLSICSDRGSDVIHQRSYWLNVHIAAGNQPVLRPHTRW
jgi:hypothetical protein